MNLPSLPRGDYSIVVEGPGPLMARPVAISRNQVLDLKFYSWLDIGLVGGFLAAFAIGTLCLGWWRRRAHNSVAEDNEVQPDLDDESASTIRLSIPPASAASVSWTHPPGNRLQRRRLRRPETHIDGPAHRRAGDHGGS